VTRLDVRKFFGHASTDGRAGHIVDDDGRIYAVFELSEGERDSIGKAPMPHGGVAYLCVNIRTGEPILLTTDELCRFSIEDEL
jgi:hypothetical protein